MNKETALLALVVLLAFVLRFWNIGGVPPSPSLDEVSIGWNAYSILKTGADEYGTRFPMLLHSYDDWRPALYVYLVIPFVKIFKLNAFSVRFPSVILSVLTVLATYFLTKELIRKTDNKGNKKANYKLQITNYLPLISAGLLSISPWHVYLSRLGHEANAGLAFLVFGILFFFKKRYSTSSLFFALSFMSYQSQKIIVPFILFSLLLLFWSKLRNAKKKLIIPVLLFIVLTAPFVIQSLSSNALIRARATNVFAKEYGAVTDRGVRYTQAVDSGNALAKLVLQGEIVLSQYVSHFNPKWLFANSGNESFKAPNLGLLWFWELPLLLLGFVLLYKADLSRNLKAFILLWLFSAPIAASVTTQAPHAMRAYTAVPAIQIMGALGFGLLVSKLYRYKTIIMSSLLIVVMYSLYQFYNNYFIQFPQRQSDSFQYALKNSISYVLEHEDEYQRVVFSNKDNLYQSYMFFLFYSKYDPKIYQAHGGTVSGGYAERHVIGKYEFRPIEWENEKRDETLFVGNVEDFPEGENGLYKGFNMNGEHKITINK